jgi:hypothetical protein
MCESDSCQYKSLDSHDAGKEEFERFNSKRLIEENFDD